MTSPNAAFGMADRILSIVVRKRLSLRTSPALPSGSLATRPGPATMMHVVPNRRSVKSPRIDRFGPISAIPALVATSVRLACKPLCGGVSFQIHPLTSWEGRQRTCRVRSRHISVAS
jgi:hypothetical protein